MAGETVFTGRVASAPASPYISIACNTVVTGAFGNPLTGQTVHFGITAGGSERGKRRLRVYTDTGSGTATLTIDESDDVGPIIQVNDFVTIRNEIRLWPKYPRFVQSGTQVTIFEDYDVAYSNQLNNYAPTAVPGPPGVEFLSGGQAKINFVGDRSFATAPGASIVTYAWTAWDSVEATSSAQGTEASPVTFTWTAPGRYLVRLTVTDSGGVSHTGYTWAVVIDPDDPGSAGAFVDFDNISDSVDFNQGGGQCGFVVRGDINKTDFPEEMMVLHAVRGDLTTPTGSWPFRANLLFSGWVQGNSVRQDPDTGEVTFRAGTIDMIMRNLSMFPASLTDTATPTNWTQAANLTVDRAAHYLYHYRSTLASMAPIRPSNFSGLIRRQDFGPGDLYGQIQNNLMNSILGKIISDHQGVLHHVIDYNVQNATERAGVTTRKLLHKGEWINNVNIEERHDYGWPASQVKMSGIYYPGGQIEDICPLFSEAPGDAPKAYGRESNFDRLILLSQSDLNVRTGHMLEKLDQRYPVYRMEFINDGAFTVAPQELFPANIEAADNDRGLSFSGNLIPRRINRRYDHQAGIVLVSVDFEPETTGAPGATVDMPCGPPEQKLPSNQPPAPPAAGSGVSKLALMAGTTGTSWYFAPGINQQWTRRINGLVEPGQIQFEDTIDDPWTVFKQGYNAERIIVWGCGRGFLARSKDSGNKWTTRTAYLPDTAWPSETGSVSTTQLYRLEGDYFSEDRLFVLGRWQEGGNWRSAVWRTDNGFDFTAHSITGSTECLALGMALDRGNGGNLYVTAWEDDGIYLRCYNALDLALVGRYNLGDATEQQVLDKTYIASPFCRFAQVGEVFIFGRMQNPQGLANPAHVLRNTNSGATGSYSVIESGWDDDICGAFGADNAGYYYAVRNG